MIKKIHKYFVMIDPYFNERLNPLIFSKEAYMVLRVGLFIYMFMCLIKLFHLNCLRPCTETLLLAIELNKK